LVEISQLQLHPPGVDLREVEDVVDQRQESLRKGAARTLVDSGYCRRVRTLIPGANRAAVNRLTKAVADAKRLPDTIQPQPGVTADHEVIAEVIDENGAPGVTLPTLTR
jgi:hypothetical protein